MNETKLSNILLYNTIYPTGWNVQVMDVVYFRLFARASLSVIVTYGSSFPLPTHISHTINNLFVNILNHINVFIQHKMLLGKKLFRIFHNFFPLPHLFLYFSFKTRNQYHFIIEIISFFQSFT